MPLGPFLHAFVWLIAVPLVLAGLGTILVFTKPSWRARRDQLGLLPVPATALVLFIVVAAFVSQLGTAFEGALRVVPIYIAFAVLAPLTGWFVAWTFRLEAEAGRAIAFSAATRNSIVVLPLAFAVLGAAPIVPAIIVTPTLVELLAN